MVSLEPIYTCIDERTSLTDNINANISMTSDQFDIASQDLEMNIQP